MSVHHVTYGDDRSLTGGGHYGACFCGWHSGYWGRHLPDGASKAREAGMAHEAEHAAPQTHDAMVGHSGDFVRIECECGHKGEWRHKDAVTLQRLLRSDINAHFWQLKRMEAAQ